MKTQVIETILKRRSTRVFDDAQLKDTEIAEIIQAGLYAPSAHNNQSWHFTVIQNRELLTKLNHESKLIAQKHPIEDIQKMGNNPNFNIFYNAPTVILLSGDEKGIMASIDCSAATQNMLIAAESLNIGSCWVGFVAFAFAGENAESLRAELKIPADFKPYFAVLLGYKKNPDGNAPKRKENKVNYIK